MVNVLLLSPKYQTWLYMKENYSFDTNKNPKRKHFNDINLLQKLGLGRLFKSVITISPFTVVTPVFRYRKWNKRVCHVISVSNTSQKDKRNILVNSHVPDNFLLCQILLMAEDRKQKHTECMSTRNPKSTNIYPNILNLHWQVVIFVRFCRLGFFFLSNRWLNREY